MSMPDIWPDPELGYADRDLEAGRKIEELQAKVTALETESARFRKALEKIARVRRGLDTTDTDEYRADYFFRQADCYQNLARKALRDTPPA